MGRSPKATGWRRRCLAENKKLNEGANQQYHGELTQKESLRKGQAANLN
jgi:hypothetical protein